MSKYSLVLHTQGDHANTLAAHSKDFAEFLMLMSLSFSFTDQCHLVSASLQALVKTTSNCQLEEHLSSGTLRAKIYLKLQ